jgi:hypothetical protein
LRLAFGSFSSTDQIGHYLDEARQASNARALLESSYDLIAQIGHRVVGQQRIQRGGDEDTLAHRIDLRSVKVAFEIATPRIENAIADDDA